jgi:hypothetical protein
MFLYGATHELVGQRRESDGLRLLQSVAERLIERDVACIDRRMRNAKNCAWDVRGGGVVGTCAQYSPDRSFQRLWPTMTLPLIISATWR